jgi:hypothetical protein
MKAHLDSLPLSVWCDASLDFLGDEEIEAQILDEHGMGETLAEILKELIGEGVPIGDICRRIERGILDPPRLDRVVYAGAGFEFARHVDKEPAVSAMTFIVRDQFGHPIDVAAWSPPRAPALWHSRGCMLGEDGIFGPRMRDELAVFRDPLGWLRNLCRGVVVLDGSKAAPLLRRAEPLAAEDVAHGRELRKMLEVRPPRILVPTVLERRAA